MAPPWRFLIFELEPKLWRSKAVFLPHFCPLKKGANYPFESLASISGLEGKFKKRLGGAIYMLMSYLPLPYMTLCLFRCELQGVVLEVFVAPLF